jgi:hypothetical protein
MGKIDVYQQKLRALAHWDTFLLQESGLPGPRGNLELAQVVAAEGDRLLFERYLSYNAEQAPTNTPQEFLAFCGVLGLGRLCAGGERELLETLRAYAADPRWRIREAVAMGLQYLGEVDMDALLVEMERWSQGTFLEQRAAAAALCHPQLLQQEDQVKRVLQLLDSITASLQSVQELGSGERKSDEFRALRKGLAYCWSVSVSALPDHGKEKMERWFASEDRDVRWIMKQNLNKKRLERMDADWVADWKSKLAE